MQDKKNNLKRPFVLDREGESGRLILKYDIIPIYLYHYTATFQCTLLHVHLTRKVFFYKRNLDENLKELENQPT